MSPIQVTTPLGEVATVTVLGAGELFGEGALFSDDERRSATALALEPVETAPSIATHSSACEPRIAVSTTS